MRQDRKDKPRVPISAKLVMNMLEAAGYERVIKNESITDLFEVKGF
jgi:ribose-phosphate pyrophosphokinase